MSCRIGLAAVLAIVPFIRTEAVRHLERSSRRGKASGLLIVIHRLRCVKTGDSTGLTCILRHGRIDRSDSLRRRGSTLLRSTMATFDRMLENQFGKGGF